MSGNGCHFQKFAIDFHALLSQLKDEVQSIEDQDWIPHVNQRDYSGVWDVVPLRSRAEHHQAHPILQSFAIESEGQWQNLPRLDFLPALTHVLSQVRCPLRAVRLMRLHPGAQIKPHRDHDLCIEQGQARLHLPIFLPERVEFKVADKVVPMNEGELWYINTDQVHSVNNTDETQRCHLVIDCDANDWLREQIHES